MLTLVLSIGIAVGCYQLSSSLRKEKSTLLEKGVTETKLNWFITALWLFVVPPFAAFLFGVFSIIKVATFIMLYVPGITLAHQYSGIFSRGYDQHRKIGKEFAKSYMLGYGGIGLVLFYWLILNWQSIVR